MCKYPLITEGITVTQPQSLTAPRGRMNIEPPVWCRSATQGQRAPKIFRQLYLQKGKYSENFCCSKADQEQAVKKARTIATIPREDASVGGKRSFNGQKASLAKGCTLCSQSLPLMGARKLALSSVRKQAKAHPWETYHRGSAQWPTLQPAGSEGRPASPYRLRSPKKQRAP